jgi:hypothetical protein
MPKKKAMKEDKFDDAETHACWTTVNDYLKEHNTRLVREEYINFKTGKFGFFPPAIPTTKIEPRKKGPPKRLLPAYCPFCGKKLT